MESDKEYFLEDLLKSTDELIKGIDGVDELLEESSESIEDKISRDTHLREIAALDHEVSPDIDGVVDIRITEDELAAIAEFFPPSGNGKSIDLIGIEDKLAQLDISYGVDWKTIETIVARCNNERVQINDIQIARGKDPVHEIPEHIVLDKKFENQAIEIDDRVQTIDYRKITAYTLVKKEETIARIIPKREGAFGKTVRGMSIPFKTDDVVTFEPMSNLEVKGDKIVAACDGRLMVHKRTIWVNEVFELRSDVDYRTGNIAFPGDIIIHGQVKDGFKVEAGGSILCKGTLDASEVNCEHNLNIEKGIVGRKKGKIKVGGIVTTKFIENCYVEARDSIYVETGIIHSIINTLKRLEMGKKSVIVGGKILAQNGIVASQIGTKMGAKTEIYCGIDYIANQKLNWVKDKLNAFATKLAMVENKLRRSNSNDGELMKVRNNLKLGIHKLNKAAKALIHHLDKNEKAEIIVRDTIFPGVYIEICHVSYIVPREMKGVRIWLDKERTKIDVGVLL